MRWLGHGDERRTEWESAGDYSWEMARAGGGVGADGCIIDLAYLEDLSRVSMRPEERATAHLRRGIQTCRDCVTVTKR